MLAFSPPFFPTNYGWPLIDDLVIASDNQDYNNGVSIQTEADSNDHFLPIFPSYDEVMHHDLAPEDQTTSISSGGAGESMMVAKKLNHNASERDRRKRVNHLYAFLRSLLPMSSDHRKKLSIPGTVSLALDYIPQLQKEVETLIQKKEKLLIATREGHVGIGEQSGKEVRKSSVISSVIVLDDSEVMIQMISSTDDHTNKNKDMDMGFFSKALEYLEEDGLILLNANTFKWYGDETRFLNTFHFQVQGNHKIEAENLKEKLCSF